MARSRTDSGCSGGHMKIDYSRQTCIEQVLTTGACICVVRHLLLATRVPAIADVLAIAPLGRVVPRGRAS